MTGESENPTQQGLHVNKKLLGIGAAVLALAVVTALLMRGIFGGDSPEEVAEAYVTAMATADIQTVCALSTAQARESILEQESAESCEELVNFADLPRTGDERSAEGEGFAAAVANTEVDVEIVDVVERGDEAEVTIRVEVAGSNDDPANATVSLKKEDGEWKVEPLRE